MNEDLEKIERRAESLVEAHAKLMRDLISMRNKHHLSQSEVAERMGVSQPTVAAFERYDSNPTLASLRRYALAVDALMEIAVIDDCLGASNGEEGRIIEADAIASSSLPLSWVEPTNHFSPAKFMMMWSNAVRANPQGTALFTYDSSEKASV